MVSLSLSLLFVQAALSATNDQYPDFSLSVPISLIPNPCSSRPIHISAVRGKSDTPQSTWHAIVHEGTTDGIPHSTKMVKSMTLYIERSDDQNNCTPESLILSDDESKQIFRCSLHDSHSDVHDTLYLCTSTLRSINNPSDTLISQRRLQRRLSTNQSTEFQTASESVTQQQLETESQDKAKTTTSTEGTRFTIASFTLSTEALTLCIVSGLVIGLLSCVIAIYCVQHFVAHLQRPRYGIHELLTVYTQHAIT